MGKVNFLREPEDPDFKFTLIICVCILLYFGIHIIRAI